jgi:hypothetical protein
MTRALLAAFSAADPMLAAARTLRDSGRTALDAFTPYPVEGIDDALALKPSAAPWAMLVGGLGVAGCFYLLELFSSVWSYPFDQGARPHNSWPTFVLAPVEFGVLAAALSGLVYFLIKAGLPRLHHPLFDHTAFERATQDQFMLAAPLPEAPEAQGELRRDLFDAGAVWIEEVEL